jgi:DUF2946 family protein
LRDQPKLQVWTAAFKGLVEVAYMPRFCRIRAPLRSWLAAAAAFALVLQTLLSGLAATHLDPFAGSSFSDAFVICHGNGNGSTDGGQDDGTGKSPAPQSSCIFCTLVRAASAVLPTDHGIAFVESVLLSALAPAAGGEAVAYQFPKTNYQRGPPIASLVVG